MGSVVAAHLRLGQTSVRAVEEVGMLRSFEEVLESVVRLEDLIEPEIHATSTVLGVELTS